MLIRVEELALQGVDGGVVPVDGGVDDVLLVGVDPLQDELALFDRGLGRAAGLGVVTLENASKGCVT